MRLAIRRIDAPHLGSQIVVNISDNGDKGSPASYKKQIAKITFVRLSHLPSYIRVAPSSYTPDS